MVVLACTYLLVGQRRQLLPFLTPRHHPGTAQGNGGFTLAVGHTGYLQLELHVDFEPFKRRLLVRDRLVGIAPGGADYLQGVDILHLKLNPPLVLEDVTFGWFRWFDRRGAALAATAVAVTTGAPGTAIRVARKCTRLTSSQ